MNAAAGRAPRCAAACRSWPPSALIVLVPVVWIVAAGFRTQISLLIGEFFFTPVLTNFTEVLFSKTSDFLVNYRNSLIVGHRQHAALPDGRRRSRPGR